MALGVEAEAQLAVMVQEGAGAWVGVLNLTRGENPWETIEVILMQGIVAVDVSLLPENLVK